jgi:hypothetical protein
MLNLSPAHKEILLAMASGHTLKSHRDVEGQKVFQLHALDGEVEAVDWEAVEYLQDNGLIDSNKKFPAAMYWLTETGQRAVSGDGEG